MAELHARLFLKPPKSVDLSALRMLFATDSKEMFVEVARGIGSDDAEKRARDFVSSIPRFDELKSERTRNVRGFAIWKFVLGIDGVSVTENILDFLVDLVPAAEAWAYVVTDDDPIETWFRVVDGKIVREENEPGQDEEEDRQTIEAIYAWWHDGLPKSIFEGQLIEARDEVPQPQKVEHAITKTQVSGVPDVCWENIFFNIVVSNDQDLDPDWQDPRGELTEANAEKALRLLRACCVNYRRCDVEFRAHSGSSGSIKFVFSENPDSNLYALNYAALCLQCGGEFKQFVSTHSDHEIHYLTKDGDIVVEKRAGGAVLETTSFSVDQVLEIVESDVGG